MSLKPGAWRLKGGSKPPVSAPTATSHSDPVETSAYQNGRSAASAETCAAPVAAWKR